jgi:hypothetical protein
MLDEKCNFESLYNKPKYQVVSIAFFDIHEYRSRRNTVTEM